MSLVLWIAGPLPPSYLKTGFWLTSKSNSRGRADFLQDVATLSNNEPLFIISRGDAAGSPRILGAFRPHGKWSLGPEGRSWTPQWRIWIATRASVPYASGIRLALAAQYAGWSPLSKWPDPQSDYDVAVRYAGDMAGAALVLAELRRRVNTRTTERREVSWTNEAGPTPDSRLARTSPRRKGSTPAALDVEVAAIQRTEMSYLRRVLFPSPIATCDLCGSQLPRDLLVAAHIKPRALCTLGEKRDIPFVVMAACALGCDSLYEAGHLTVDEDWVIHVLPAGAGRFADLCLAKAAHRVFPKRDGRRRAYFKWHHEHVFLPVAAVRDTGG